MSDKLKNAWEAVLALTAEERAELAGRLLDELDNNETDPDQAAIDAAWGREADRRYQAYKRGEERSVPIEDVRKKIQQWMQP